MPPGIAASASTSLASASAIGLSAPTRATQAEFIVADALEVARMPPALDFIQAASLRLWP